ncbi:hypothetical protein [Chryseobacterium gleum]|uniref:hypothetical protein n=1 Tax=Chryseobacterium gleum TaxID=250 RepID=UPI00241E113D|nr:hypothetical protein [Chryseobacterium gleum]
MQLQILIGKEIYLVEVKKAKGKMKLFFKSDNMYHNSFGFDLPFFCCDNISHKWRIWNTFKNDLHSGKYKDVHLLPE